MNTLKINTGYIFVFLIRFLVFIDHSPAQDIRTDILQIKYYYEDLRFGEAIQAGRALLEDRESIIDPVQLVLIHQYLGFAFFQLNQVDSARIQFLTLLSIDPQKELDPLTTSPKILQLFEQIKNDLNGLGQSNVYLPYPKYIFLEDKRPAAAWRSAVLPGWGQYYKGQTQRAYIMGGSFALSAVTLIVSAIYEKDYRNRYLDNTNPEEISKLYSSYNRWSKIRQVSTYTTIGIWMIVFADALWMDPRPSRLELSVSHSQVNQDLISISVSHTF